VLGEVAKHSQDAFHSLSQAEKDELIKGLKEHKATKAKGMQTLNKLHINDITHTVDMIEKEIWIHSHLQ
jgi:hypothetical protein